MRGKRKRTKRAVYRSGLEKVVGECMDAALVEWEHEAEKLKYEVPATRKTYLPDFRIKKSPSLIVEAKGIFTASDRKKMLLVKEQHPDREILMVFGRAKNPIRKGSSTTYSDWCDKNGIRWVDILDFKKDPRACLLPSTRKQRTGKSTTSLRRKQNRSSRSVRKPSSGA